MTKKYIVHANCQLVYILCYICKTLNVKMQVLEKLLLQGNTHRMLSLSCSFLSGKIVKHGIYLVSSEHFPLNQH